MQQYVSNKRLNHLSNLDFILTNDLPRLQYITRPPGLQSQESRGLVQATAGQVHLGTTDPCRSHATASRAYLLRSLIKLLLLHLHP
jgi:hypothetical protein